MELENHTRFAAHLFHGVLGEDLIYATLVVRAGFVVGKDGGLRPLDPPEEVRQAD